MSYNFRSLLDILQYRLQKQSSSTSHIFLQDGETKTTCLTYGELNQQALSIAAYLQSTISVGERALLLYPPGLEFIAAFLGCIYAGIVAVPVYPPRRNQKLSRLLCIAGDAQAKVALTTISMMASIEKRLKDEEKLCQLQLLATDNIEGKFQGFTPYLATPESLAFLQYTSGSTGKPKGVMISHNNLMHNLNMIHECFEHASNKQGVVWLPPYHDMGLIGGILQPIYGGFPVTLMPPVAFLQRPLRWLQAISRYQATTSGGPNFAYDLCVEKIQPESCLDLDLSSWSVAFTGAETVRPETLERFANTFAPYGFRKDAFYPCYGMAEGTLMVSGGLKENPPVIRQINETKLSHKIVTDSANSKERSRAIVGCGRSWLDQKIIIVNPESKSQCPAEEVGEIWVSGASVALGYWEKPEKTMTDFNAYITNTEEGPFLRTGDLGFLLDGELFVTGRIKDMIIIRGRNHYPQDIEQTVQKCHPALRPNAGAAFSVEIDGIERLVIAQEVERSYLRQLNVDEVFKAINQKVSQEHQLQIYALVLLKTASIPKTSSGKIQRHACKTSFLDDNLCIVSQWKANLQQIELLQLEAEIETLWLQLENSTKQHLSQNEDKSQINSSQVFVPTRKAIETWLISNLASYLKMSPHEIDIREPFAVYGLDSSVAINITDELAQWLGYEIEPTLFWEYPSIEELAMYLEIECQLTESKTSSVNV